MELTLHDMTFCVRRLPRDVRDQMKREGQRLFVAGGFIRSVIANETVNDVDLFTPTPNDAERLALELSGDRKPYVTGNAYTITARRTTVQYISRWSFSRPQEAMESFDFTIAKAAIWWYDGKGTRWQGAPGWRSECDDDFYADLAARRLVYTSPVRNEDAGGSLLRVLKFYQRGYRIPLDSMGAVTARLVRGLDFDNSTNRLEWLGKHPMQEKNLAKAITGLLREVDPIVDPDAEGHENTVNCSHGHPVEECPQCQQRDLDKAA